MGSEGDMVIANDDFAVDNASEFRVRRGSRGTQTEADGAAGRTLQDQEEGDCQRERKEALSEGDMIIANDDFAVDNASEFRVRRGSRGTVVKVDCDGDVQAEFEGYEGYQKKAWIFKQ